MAKARVICQPWAEFDRVGNRKPDGYTLHITNNDRNAYIDKYWEDLGTLPETHSAPYGTPYVTEVDEATVRLIKARGLGQWRMGELPPLVGKHIYM